MKNIKKYISITFVAVIALATMVSCEDEDKFRFPPDLGNGAFVRFIDFPEFNAGADPLTANFTAVTEASNNNVTSYELKVRGFFDGATTDTISFGSTTTFPFDVSFTGQDMADLFGVDIATFVANDQFKFFGSAVRDDGTVYNGDSSSCDECPQDPQDPENPESTGTWNGGNTADPIYDTGDNAFLLQAYRFTVKFSDPN